MDKQKSSSKNPKKSSPQSNLKKKKIISISVLVAGLAMLIVGVVFLVLNIISSQRAADGEYLVSADSWSLEGGEGVVWDFTEIGKGTLTTNGHLNDYDFIWAIEDDKLKIETDWLYDLGNEYTYQLDQSTGTLILTAGDDSYTFIAQP